MTYKLTFLPQALKEWKKLDFSIQKQFKEKLQERLEMPEVPKDKLHGDLSHCYKIKLRQLGYRLVYQVHKNEVSILVISVGRRENLAVYGTARKRI